MNAPRPLAGHQARRLVARRRAVEEAVAARDTAILDAHNDGASLRAIADAAGLTHTGVAKIIRRRVPSADA